MDAPIDECVPDVKLVEHLIGIDDELLTVWPLQPVPTHGTNEQQLHWCMAASESSLKANSQLIKIRTKQREALKND